VHSKLEEEYPSRRCKPHILFKLSS
jgi:hypothetical protein